jgi:hypothetical protein
MAERSKLHYQLIAAWCGIGFTVVFFLGWYAIGHFYSPATATLSPQDLANYFALHRHGIAIGCTLCCVAAALHIPWTALLGLVMARIEGSPPLLSMSQVIGGALTILVFSFPPTIWVAAAYRPPTDPNLLRAMNDAAWMGFDLTWALTSVQMAAACLVGLADVSSSPLFPRWLCYGGLAGAVAFASLTGISFVHSGPFAWSGALSFWIPYNLWVVWFVGFSICMIADVRRKLREEMAPTTGQAPRMVQA